MVDELEQTKLAAVKHSPVKSCNQYVSQAQRYNLRSKTRPTPRQASQAIHDKNIGLNLADLSMEEPKTSGAVTDRTARGDIRAELAEAKVTDVGSGA